MSRLCKTQLFSRWMVVTALLAVCAAGAATEEAQAQDASDQPFMAGAPLDLSSNAKTYGGFRFARAWPTTRTATCT